MNILFYMSSYPGYGGIETVTSILMPIIKEAIGGGRISVLAHVSIDNPQCYVDGIDIHCMPDAIVGYTKKNYKYAETVFQNGNFGAVVYQDSYGRTERIVGELASKYGVPLYVFEHNSPLFIYNKRNMSPVTTPKGFLRRVFHPVLLWMDIHRKRYLLSCCKKYVLLSKQYIPEFCKLVHADINDERITYINNPVAPYNGELEVNKQNVVLSVSRLVKEKGVDKMLKAWRELSNLLPEWRLIIIGDGAERVKLEGYVKRHQIPRVEFLGYINPFCYYRQAKILWLTSKFEGWGMTLIEAMQQACVPIAFRSYSAIVDIIDDKHNGLLIDNGNIHQLIEKTQQLAKSPMLTKELGKNAVDKVRVFEVDRIVEKWKEVLDL